MNDLKVNVYEVKNDLKVNVHEVKIDSDTFEVFVDIETSFKIYFDAQQDGHGPFPTFEDKLNEALEKIKIEILKQKESKMIC